MKKNFISMGLMFVAALTLTTNCAKEEAAPEETVTSTVKEAVPFELTVSSGETKTSTTDASTINWLANDKVNVFHAENGSATYSSNDEFTITSENLAAGTFTGALSDGALDGAKSYDWYVLYPYTSYVTTPANTSTGYHFIGSTNKDTPQVQEGYGSKAHLAGQFFPLYGKATNVPAATKPSITLNQALAIIKVHVTNSNTTALTVTDVAFTAPQPVTGRFYIDFTGAAPGFTTAGAGNVSNTANLTVNSGTPIAKDGTADFYIAIKPFTAAIGDKLKIAVNGEEKTLTIAGSAVTFQPGKIKTVNYSFDADPIIYSTTFDYTVDGSDYKNADAHIGTDVGGQTSWGLTYGNWAGSNTAQFRVYNSGGGNGTLDQRFDCSHISYFTFDAVVNNTSTTLSLVASYSTNKGSTWTTIGDPIVITTTSTKYKVTMPSDMDRARIKLVVSGERPSSGNTQLTVDNLKIYGSGAVINDPYIAADDVTNVSAAGVTDQTVSYSIHNFTGDDDVTATPDGTYVTAAAVTSAGTVTYSVAPNYTTTAKNGTITLESPRDGATKVINVGQLGETFSVSETIVYVPKDASEATFTVTSASFDWTATKNVADGKNLDADPLLGAKNASAQTITVASTTDPAESDDIVLGTIVFARTANPNDDPQKKTVTIKKAPLATVLYSCGFEAAEGFTAGTTYNNTTPLECGDTGYKWNIIYGTPSTNEAISGSNSLQMRHYNDPDTNFGSAEMQFDVTGVPTKVSFYAKVSNTSKMKLTVEYSTDEGSNWSVVSGFENKTLTTSAAAYNFDVTGSPAKYRLRFSVGSDSARQKTATKLTIDDIKFLKVE